MNEVFSNEDLSKGVLTNEVLEAIARRYSCRSYTDQMPTDEVLSAIAHAAIAAPSGMNRQNWQVIVVKDRALIAEMQAEGMSILAGMPDKSTYDRIMGRGGKLFYNAPCMIVIAVKQSQPAGAELIDCGILAQNICLAATSLGVANVHCGMVCLSFAGPRAAEFMQKLCFPEGYGCGMGVLLGYATAPVPPHAPNPDKITVIG